MLAPAEFNHYGKINMKNNITKAIIQVLVLSSVLLVGEIIYSITKHPINSISLGFPFIYYDTVIDFTTDTELSSTFIAPNLLIDIIFSLSVAAILVIVKNKLIKQK